jgi:hypothetical protein
MFSRAVRIVCVVSLCMAFVSLTGCACCKKNVCAAKPCKVTCPTPCAAPACDMNIEACALPPNAKPGECYAKVYVPPKYETYTERICTRPAYERLEVVPAKYEWAEERICVKDGCDQLQVTEPQFACREQTMVVQPSFTDWEVNKNPQCVGFPGEPAQDVFCLVSHPCVEKSVPTQCLEKPACVQKVCVAPEYQTVRRQKLVCPATTRKVCIPAEYTDVPKTRKVCDAKIVWRRVPCELPEPGVVRVPSEPCPPIPLTPPTPVGARSVTPGR